MADVDASHTHDGRRALPVVQDHGSARRLGARWLVVALAATAAALWGVSLSLPWWRFWLFAPQYPKGLGLVISLNGVSGDVREINLLNHYIGMKHLEEAAAFERAHAGWGIAAVAIVVVLFMLATGRRLGWLAALAAVMFPVGFVADSTYWLWKFGHDLDPRSPLHIKPFTPQMFGEGIIGQFHTYAIPDTGFWVALAGVVCVVAAVLLRARVCNGCARRFACGAVCPSGFVGPGAGVAKEAKGG